jgi:chromosome segregation ATPase
MPTPYQISLKAMIEDSKKVIRGLKRVNPGTFHEYTELLSARRGLKEARERLKTAEAAWKRLGN